MASSSKKASTKKSGAKKKTAAAKSAAKKTSKKVEVATKTTQPKQLSKYELLKRFHLFAALIAVVIAVCAALLLNTQAVDITTTYSAKDPIASGEETVLGTAYETLFNVQIRYLIAAAFVVAAGLSILLATVLRDRYEAGVKNGTSFYRWLFGGIVLGLILEIISILTGIQDIVTLKIVAGLSIVTTMLGYLAERDNKNVSSPKWVAYYLSLLTGFLAWLPAVATVIGTHVYGIERFGWYVYALVVVVLFGCCRIALAQYRSIKSPTKNKDYILQEEKYLSNEMFIKLAFAAIIFIALIN